jgi:hypothetical protein
MKGSEYIANIRKRVDQNAMNKAVMSAALTVVADMSQRIFVEGKASNGSDIGKYDTENELYVSPENSPKKLPLKGKDGKSKKANGEKYKTSYFESYSAFKKKVSGKNNKVNLNLFGILQSNFANGVSQDGNAVIVSLTEENDNKKEGQEARFNKKIFFLSKQERAKYVRLVKSQFKIYAK